MVKVLKSYLLTNYNWEKVIEKLLWDLKKFDLNFTNVDEIEDVGKFHGYSFFLAKNFMSIGDYVSSKNLYLTNKEYTDTSFEKQLNVLIIEQKYGLLNDAYKHYHQTINQQGYTNLDEKVKTLFELVYFKINSQLNKHEYVVQHHESLVKKLTDLGEDKRVFSVHNRAAIAYASLDNQDGAIQAIKKADQCIKGANKHTEATSLMYKLILSYFKKVNLGTIDPMSSIQKCQRFYFEEVNGRTNIRLWQSHNFKSIIQCLFVESTLDYYQGNETAWQLKLIAANLLTSKAMSSPTSEGYASLLAVIMDSDFKDLLSLAMYSDLDHRNKFQQDPMLKNVSSHLIHLEHFVSRLFNDPDVYDNWIDLKDHIDNYER